VLSKYTGQKIHQKISEDLAHLKEVYQKGSKVRVIAPYPTVALILSKHKPLLISEEGWDYIISWVADIGSVMRSRAYMVSVAVSLSTQILLTSLLGMMSTSGVRIGKKVLR